jgi:hypothetical protein
VVALLYLPEGCFSSCLFRGGMPGLGQVEFRGTRGGGGTTEVPHSTARTDVKEICRENVAHLAAVWEKA